MAMRSPVPMLTQKQRVFLNEVISGRAARNDHIRRAQIILSASRGDSDLEISTRLDIRRETVGIWRRRWMINQENLQLFDEKESGINYKRCLLSVLSDAQRSGAPCKFTPEQICQIINVSCEKPEDIGLPLSHWSLASLAEELVKRKIVDSISSSQLAVFLKSGGNKTTQSDGVDPYADRK